MSESSGDDCAIAGCHVGDVYMLDVSQRETVDSSYKNKRRLNRERRINTKWVGFLEGWRKRQVEPLIISNLISLSAEWKGAVLHFFVSSAEQIVD